MEICDNDKTLTPKSWTPGKKHAGKVFHSGTHTQLYLCCKRYGTSDIFLTRLQDGNTYSAWREPWIEVDACIKVNGPKSTT